MTTRAAAEQYLAAYLHDHESRKLAYFNPNALPIGSLPVIYGFNNGGNRDYWHGQLIAQDGTPLGSHICSHEGYMPGDLGILDGACHDRHERFQTHYPNGYRMEFIGLQDVKGHTGLAEAFRLHHVSATEPTP